MWTRDTRAYPDTIPAPSYGSRLGAAATPTSRPWELTEGELALNKEINGTRVVVEHAVGMIKRYRMITTRPFWGTSKDLNDELNIISGLVNLNLDWDRIKEENKLLMRELARKRALRQLPGGPGPPSNHAAKKPYTPRCC